MLTGAVFFLFMAETNPASVELWETSQYIMHETGDTGLDTLSDSVGQQFMGTERQKDISDGSIIEGENTHTQPLLAYHIVKQFKAYQHFYVFI